MAEKGNIPALLYIIQLPPPVHGVSTINNIVYNSETVNKNFEKSILRLRYAKSIDDLRKFRIIKVIILLNTIIKLIIKIIRKKYSFVYFSLMPVGKGFVRDFFYILVLQSFKIHIVYHIHNRGIAQYSKKRFYKWMYNFSFRNCSIIYLSESIRKEEYSEFVHSNIKFFKVCNGITPTAGEASGEKSEQIVFLFLSNLFPQKGIFDLLEAFKMLIDHFGSAIRLDIAGAGTKHFLKEFSGFSGRNPAVMKQVNYLGAKFGIEKFRCYENADIFVLPSYFSEESFPLTILEAMSFSLPVISTRIGAIPEIVSDGVNGYIIEPRNISMLYEKAKVLIEERDTRIKMGLKSREIYLNHYTQKHFEQKMRTVFENIISG